MRAKKNPEEAYYKRLFSVARRTWSMSCPAKKATYAAAEVVNKYEGLKKYKCSCCKSLFARSDTQCDHTTAIGAAPTSLSAYVDSVMRLHAAALTIMCKKCHAEKTRKDVLLIKLHGAGQSANARESLAALKAKWDFVKREGKRKK